MRHFAAAVLMTLIPAAALAVTPTNGGMVSGTNTTINNSPGDQTDPSYLLEHPAARRGSMHPSRPGHPSPTAGSETSQKANAAADQAAYRPIAYTNANKQGPALIVLPGDIKSNNATFLQKFTANNIADFGELELSSANFQVLER